MQVEVVVGDVLDLAADVLISTANPRFQMTDGVNLKVILRARGELFQQELQAHRDAIGGQFVEPPTVECTQPES